MSEPTATLAEMGELGEEDETWAGELNGDGRQEGECTYEGQV